MFWILYGAIGAALSIGVHFVLGLTGMEIFVLLAGFGTALLVGGGVRLAAGERDGWGPGLTAVALALPAMFVGRVIAFHEVMAQELRADQAEIDADLEAMGEESDFEYTEEDLQNDIAEATSDDAMIDMLVYDTQEELIASGELTEQQIEQHAEAKYEEYERMIDADPGDGTWEEPGSEFFIHPTVWQKSKEKWESMSPEEQQEHRDEAESMVRMGAAFVENADQVMTWGGGLIMAILSFFLPIAPLLCSWSAVFGAFRIGAKMGTGD